MHDLSVVTWAGKYTGANISHEKPHWPQVLQAKDSHTTSDGRGLRFQLDVALVTTHKHSGQVYGASHSWIMQACSSLNLF